MKLLDILKESKRVKLPEEFITVLNNVVDMVFKKRKSFKKKTPITSIPIIVADGTPGSVEIVVDPNLDAYGELDSKDETWDPNDFIVTVNPTMISSKKNLYQTLYHEIMHATDPNFSTKSTESYWEDYDPEDEEKYYGHNIEFRAFSNEFIEGIMNEFKLRRKRISNPKSVQALNDSLNNILNYFASNEPLSTLSKDIISDSFGGELSVGTGKPIKHMILNYPELTHFIKNSNEDLDYLETLSLIKKYSPENWKRFLNMFYSASQEIKEFIK